MKRIWLAELSVLLPELRDQHPDLPPPLPLEPAQSQARLLEALTQAFRGLAGASPLLLCLDDLHAADEGTLAWLNYATGQLAGSGVCILAAYRTQDRDILAGWQRALSRSACGSHLHLKTLDGQVVQTLMQFTGASRETAAELAPYLHEATGGNAYFLLETIRELLESGSLQEIPLPIPLPQTVREAVLRRADRLSPLTRQVLDMAAVLSPLLDIPLLAETSARSELEVAGALDDLVRRQLLVPDDPRFRFQHDLTREAIYREISDWRTRLLHRRAAQVLEQQPDRQTEYTAVIARHYEEAGDYAQAIAGYRQAAVEAQAINAFQIAAGNLRQALQLLPTGEESASLRSDLLERLGDCQRLGGQFDAALSRYQEALFFTEEENFLSRARILRKTAEALWPMDRPQEAIETLRQAAKLLKPLLEKNRSSAWPEWINIHLTMSWSYYWSLDLNGILTSLAEIKPLFDEVGFAEQKQRYVVYTTLAEFLRCRYRLDPQTVAITRQHFEMAKQTGNQYFTAETEFRLGFTLLWSGDPAAARKHLAHSLGLCEELALHFLWVQNATYLLVAARLMGDVTAVAGFYPQAWEITKQVGTQAYTSLMQSIGAWLAYREGDMTTAETAARGVAATWQQVAVPFEWLARWVLLAVALNKDRLEDAVLQARIMTTPPQALLADAVNAALETALSLWDKGEIAAAREALAQAQHLAEEANYL